MVHTPARITQTEMTRTGKSTLSHGRSHKERSTFLTVAWLTTLWMRRSARLSLRSSVSTKPLFDVLGLAWRPDEFQLAVCSIGAGWSGLRRIVF